MTDLKRLTTQYDPSEDRFRLTGIDHQGRTLCLWLTQRLFNRLIPHLCEGLEKQASTSAAKGTEQPLRAHVEQSFAQQRARAALPRQVPVVAADTAVQWRVDALDIKRAAGGVRLIFKGTLEAEQAEVKLPTPALRQWLGIVFDQYRHAGWPMQVWPAWMEDATASRLKVSAMVLH